VRTLCWARPEFVSHRATRIACGALAVLLATGCAQRHDSLARKSVEGPSGAPAASATTATVASREVTLEVGGMVCQSCVEKVQRQLASVPGVRGVAVNLERQQARVECDAGVADTSLTAAVRRAGPDYLGFVVTQ
jgi:copper chaperone CopZ